MKLEAYLLSVCRSLRNEIRPIATLAQASLDRLTNSHYHCPRVSGAHNLWRISSRPMSFAVTVSRLTHARQFTVPRLPVTLLFTTVDLGRDESMRMTVDVKLPGMFRGRRGGPSSLASDSAPPRCGTNGWRGMKIGGVREALSRPALGHCEVGCSLAARPEISF